MAHNQQNDPASLIQSTNRKPNQRTEEVRLYGVNACLGVFTHRPADIRKVYLAESRIRTLQPVLAWCVKQRLGYRVVETTDLDKLTQTQHHEGVCFEVIKRPPLTLTALLETLPRNPNPTLLSYLDGVGNPHNFGAVLRSAAHFGVAGVVVTPDSGLNLSGAACRVAEGGAESVRLAQARCDDATLAQLRQAGFAIAASGPHTGNSLYATRLPARLVLLLGAEGAGVSQHLLGQADMLLTIPGTDAVESLNIAASAAVLFAEYYRQNISK